MQSTAVQNMYGCGIDELIAWLGGRSLEYYRPIRTVRRVRLKGGKKEGIEKREGGGERGEQRKQGRKEERNGGRGIYTKLLHLRFELDFSEDLVVYFTVLILYYTVLGNMYSATHQTS